MDNLTLADAIAEVERRMIAEALRKHNDIFLAPRATWVLPDVGLYLKLGRHEMSASA